MKVNSYINHPFVVWGSCFLWLTSVFAIGWSLLLFFCIGDILLLTGVDIINAIVLLSGLITLPTNISILCAVANGKKIDYKSKVLCCPLWLCIICIIVINTIGLVLCCHKLVICKAATHDQLNNTIKHYRSVPRYKHFVDNLQWSLKCCGLNSYRDWFDCDWYDAVQDYEWDPPKNSLTDTDHTVKRLADSVPLSCCKSGSCIANFLLELGTGSINTRGCGDLLTDIMMTLMVIHVGMFLSAIVVEVILLTVLFSNNEQCINNMPKAKPGSKCNGRDVHLRNIMSIRNNFRASSASLRMMPEDSDEFEDIPRSATSQHCLRYPRTNRTASDISKE